MNTWHTYGKPNQLDSIDCDPNKRVHNTFLLVTNIAARYRNQFFGMFGHLLPMLSMTHFENARRKYICNTVHYLDRIFHLYKIPRRCNSISVAALYHRRIFVWCNNNSHGHIDEYNSYYLSGGGRIDRGTQCQRTSFGPHLIWWKERFIYWLNNVCQRIALHTEIDSRKSIEHCTHQYCQCCRQFQMCHLSSSIVRRWSIPIESNRNWNKCPFLSKILSRISK